tara:strand:- start:619 stop:2085 length:1467 start_codon:yes stop_codon:yes gene_type:complete
MKVERPPVLLLFFLISIGFHCLQRLHADSGEFLKPVGAGWNDCCSKIVREAQACGDQRLAAYIQNWPLPDELGPTQSQVIASIDKKLLKPAWLEKSSEHLWTDFVQLRQQRALYFFEIAKDEIQKQIRIPVRSGMQSSNDSVRLLVRVLRENPDHKMSRRALGYVKHRDQWVWPNVARQLTQKKEYSPEEGWLRNGKKTIQSSPQTSSLLTGRLSAQTSDTTQQLFHSDHWHIRSTAGAPHTAALAKQLELTRFIWRQVFGGFVLTPVELSRRIVGQARPRPTSLFKVVLLANREEYIDSLQSLEPDIGRTLGIYWTPTQTAWFFSSQDLDSRTVEHEATHQLFAESWPTSPLAGSKHGMWALEAAACYMESLERTDFGFTAGGRQSGRVPAARERLLDDNFFLPLRQLSKLGRSALQNEPELPKIYSQLSGLADFFMNGEGGRYRNAFIEYLVQLYRGTAEQETLWKLCRRSPEELDTEYKRYLSSP